MRSLFIALLMVGVAGPFAFADKLYMKDGQVMEGKILEITEKYIRLEKDGKAVDVPGPTILAYDKDDMPNDPGYDEYLKRIAAVDRKKAESWFELGEWCSKTDGFRHMAKYYYGFAREVDPNFEPACKALGLVQHDGKWLTNKEKMDALGLVQYEGSWITKQEAAEKIDKKLSDKRLELERMTKEVSEMKKAAEGLKAEIARARAELQEKYNYRRYRYYDQEYLLPNNSSSSDFQYRYGPRAWYQTPDGGRVSLPQSTLNPPAAPQQP